MPVGLYLRLLTALLAGMVVRLCLEAAALVSTSLLMTASELSWAS